MVTTLDYKMKHSLSQVLASLTASSIEKFDVYVKIDVEEAEEEVLKGSTQFVRALKPYIVLEANRNNISKILSMLRSNNYLVFITPYDSEKFIYTLFQQHGIIDRNLTLG